MRINLLVFLFFFTVSLLALEVFLRLNNRYSTYNELSNGGEYLSLYYNPSNNHGLVLYSPEERVVYDKFEFKHSWISNNDGICDKNFNKIEIENNYNILFLGDSFTEGVGTSYDSSYPRVFEKLLNIDFEKDINVINAGIGGSDVFFEYKLLEKFYSKYQPNYLVLTINSSDVNEYFVRGGFERFKENGETEFRKPPFFEFFYAKSYVVRSIVHDFFDYGFDFIKNSEREKKEDEALLEIARAIDKIDVFCERKEIKLLVVLHPFYYEILKKEKYIIGRLSKHLDSMKIDYIDTSVKFGNLIGSNTTNFVEYYWPLDGHFKGKGYEELAKEVYSHIRPKLELVLER
jgi:lysophospholipase L1-like esterase